MAAIDASAIILPKGRVGAAFFTDKDGVPTTVKEDDAVTTYTIDFTDVLASGATVSSVTWVGDGVTIDSSSLATPVATVTISGTNGEAKATTATSDSQTLVHRLRFVAPQGAIGTSDYPIA